MLNLYAVIEDGENTESVRLEIVELDDFIHAAGDAFLNAYDDENSLCRVQKKQLSKFSTEKPD